MAVTPHGIVSFPSLKEPADMSGKYELTLVFTPECDQNLLKEMKQAYMAKLKEKFSESEIKGMKHPIKKCADYDPKYYGQYPEGSIFICFRSAREVKIVDFQKNIIPPEDIVYGDTAHCTYSVYSYNTGGNKGVAFGLGAIQKIKDGENSIGGVDAFGVVEGGSNTAHTVEAKAPEAPVPADVPDYDDDLPF